MPSIDFITVSGPFVKLLNDTELTCFLLGFGYISLKR